MQPKTLLLLLASTVFLSCTRFSFYEHQSLSSLPTQAHNRSIEVFYDDSTQPTKDYVEFYDLRLVRRGRFNDQQMVKFLKDEARKKGMDAITQIQKWDETEETISFMDVLMAIGDETGEGTTTTINYGIIQGKGIKYIENIDLSKSVKTGTVFDEQTGKQVGEIKYLPNGLISETISENEESKFMLDIYFNLTEDHLLYEQKDWQTLHYFDGRIDVRRKYRMNDWLLKRVRVRHDTNLNRIKVIRVTENPGQNPLITRLLYSYNVAGQLVERKAKGARNLTEKLLYESGRLSSRSVEYGGKTYRIDLEYYQQEDLQGLIRKVE